MGRNGTLGIVIPISNEEVMHDIFHGRSVYASLAQDSTGDLEKGDRIYFYDSGKTHELIGEAVITGVTFSDASLALEDYRGKLHMDREEFERYVSSLPEGKRSMLRLIHFEYSTIYSPPVKCTLTIPESGLNMTADVIAKIRKDNM